MYRNLRKLALVIALVPCMCMLQAQNSSLMWEITGNGLKEPSYIYGTMHVSDKIAFHLTDSFFIAVKNADVIALESNPEHWIENDFGNPDMSSNYEFDESVGYSGYDGSNMYFGGSDFYTDATEVFIPDQRTYYSAFADNSWLINGYLYRYADQRGDYEEETYLDLFIFQCGKKLSKQIAPLEREQEVLRLLEKANAEPDKDQKEAENAEFLEQERMRAKLEEDGKDIYELIDEAYRAGNLDKLDSLERVVSPSRHYHYYFIEERNRNMMRRMDSILQTGKSMFTGIGAAHLPGQNGAIEILRSMGYTVRPVMGKVNNKSIKEKEKIDGIYFAQPTKFQYAYDSLFTIESPGKLYEIGGYQTNSFFMYPDMANSAYYAILRVAHHAYLRNKTPQDVYNEIDEMLYENIPGDIQSKTKITTNNGWPGFDIISKTKRGNYLRFKIVVSPVETIIFKASGIGDFMIKAKEPETFFSSIKFRNTNSNAWSNYTPEWGGLSVSLPDIRVTDDVPDGASVSNAEIVSIGEGVAGENKYWMSTYYLNDIKYIEEDSFELVRIADVFAKQFKKQDYKNQGYKFSTYQGKPACTGVWKSAQGTYLHTQSVINGPYYIFMTAFTNNNTVPSDYFNSLKLIDLTYNQEFTTYTDTSLYFTVKTIFPEPDTLLTLEEVDMGGYNDYGYNDDDDEDEIDEDYLELTRKTYFSSETTPENIYVVYHKYNDYTYFKNKKAFWNSFDTVYSSSFNLTRRKFSEKDDIQSLEFLLTDTNSTRGIYKKFILKDNAIFQLSTCIDTTKAPSLFVSNFYNTFTPSDSVDGRSVFASPADNFFAALDGTDTMKRKQAIAAVDIVNLDNSDAPRMISYMESSKFKKMKMDDRVEFINALSTLKHATVVPELKKIYNDAGDSSSLQTAVLNALSEMHTLEATKAFSELLYIETPLAQKGYSLGWIFSDFSDSLKLAASLFPQLWDFTSFPEYHYPTYRLLAKLYAEDSTRLKLYADHKKQVITQASAELKRNLTDDDEDDDDNSYSRYYNKHYFTKLKDITDNDEKAVGNFYGTDQFAEKDEDYIGLSTNLISRLGLEDDDLNTRFDWASSLQDYYSILLTPFYDDPMVKKYYDRILRCKDKDLILSTALTMLEKGLPVPDSVWTNLQKSREYRYETIDALMEMGRKDKIDTTYGNQRMITECILYQYDFTKDEDSIQFITKTLVHTREGDGYIYFYKSKMGKDKGWSLDCTGLQPENGATYTIEPMFVHYGDVILDEEDQQKKMDEIIRNIELLGRDRVSIKFDGDKSYDYYDY
ncbi:MAG TPA: TraB/GumN family protein [Chitinophagales bacterium]|nr:TraB/GumN family protein [Chitinophagales bacterium]HMZ88861.1 TraB/GumN family protein [Chitinophagales bacterium]HNE44880.1 TraB/GumN family protein [Chitinophagales bacterium]HNJ89893.1 TraB/GumN family protein [Chitinophagales bacterium]HNK97909.1 TraB/GumN family protein [Chitinophagales bacterium]